MVVSIALGMNSEVRAGILSAAWGLRKRSVAMMAFANTTELLLFIHPWLSKGFWRSVCWHAAERMALQFPRLIGVILSPWMFWALPFWDTFFFSVPAGLFILHDLLISYLLMGSMKKKPTRRLSCSYLVPPLTRRVAEMRSVDFSKTMHAVENWACAMSPALLLKC